MFCFNGQMIPTPQMRKCVGDNTIPRPGPLITL